MRWCIKKIFISFFVSHLFCSSAFPCFTVIVGKEATAAKKNLMARTSDSKDARRAKRLKIYTTTDGLKLYIGLPYWDLVFDPSQDMSQVATNRFGVSISATQTIQSNRIALTLDPPTGSGQGVSEPNIPSIVMPTATSAKEAVKLLGRAIESRGVNDGWGFGVIIGDSQELWYLETLSGHQWVAIRIPEDVYFVAANGPGQIQSYTPEQYSYLFSHYQGYSPIQFADVHGFSHYQSGKFNFRETYGDLQRVVNRNSNYVRLAYAQHFFNPSTRAFDSNTLNQGQYPMFLKPEHPISIADIKALQASHYLDFPEYDPYVWSYHDQTTHPFYSPIANLRTSNAHITEIGAPLDKQDVSLSNVQYIALGMPGFSVYLPIYYGLSTVPTALKDATNQADDVSLFWQFRKIQTLVFLDDLTRDIPYAFDARQFLVMTEYALLDIHISELQKQMEAAYTATRDPAIIDQFTQTVVDKTMDVNQRLIATLADSLHVADRYQLSTATDFNRWFTQTLRTQECHYRHYRCDPQDQIVQSAMVDE